MVGADRAPKAADVGDVVAGAHVLRTAERQQIAELGVRAVVHGPVAFHGQEFAVLVRAELQLHPERRALAGVGDVLLVVVPEEHRPAGGHARHSQQGFHGGAELVAESAARGVLHEAQLLRLDPQAGGDHRMVKVYPDALGVDGEPPFFVEVGEADVGLHGQVRLALQVELVFHHVGRRLHERPGVRPFGDGLLEVDVGSARMDLHGVLGHGRRRAHVGGQHFQLDLHLGRGGAGVLLGVRADDGDGVAVLEDLGVAQDGAVPAVAFVGGEGDEAGDPVLALDVLVGHDLVDAGHLLRFGGIDGQDVGVRDLGLHQGQSQRVGRHLETQVGAVVDGTRHFGHGRRPGKAVPQIRPSAGSTNSRASRGISPRITLAASITASTMGL